MENGKLKVLIINNSNNISPDGLLPGDFIESFNGRPITSLKLLSDEVESVPIGKRVSAEIVRNEKLIKLHLPVLKGEPIFPDHR